MGMNRKWHEKHRMPKNATEAERMNWHQEHAKSIVGDAIVIVARYPTG